MPHASTPNVSIPVHALALALGLALAGSSVRAQDADGDGIPDAEDNCPAVANCGTGSEELQEVTEAGLAGNAEYGNSVAISADGSTLLVGALRVDPSFGHGAAFAYERVGDVWSFRQKLEVPRTDIFQNFFSAEVTLSGDGSWALISAPNEGAPAGEPFGLGTVYAFERVAGVWHRRQRLVPAGAPGCSDNVRIGFGRSLALSLDGRTAAAGSNAGVSIWTREYGVWTQVGCHEEFSTSLGFGVGVSGDGTTVAVGAPFSDVQGTGNGGAVALFREVAGVWSEIDRVNADAPVGGDLFGRRVALDLDGSTLAVGSPYHPSGAQQIGGAWVFEEAAGSWTQVAAIEPSSVSFCDGETCFGTAIALDPAGERLWIGAPSDDENDVGSGAVYLWSRGGGGTWSEAAKFSAARTDSGDQFGNALALANRADMLLVGSEKVDHPDPSGSAFVFGPGCQVDRDFDGAGNACDCAPADPTRHPGAPEVCDGEDNDCDTLIDEGQDADGDLSADCVDLCPAIPWYVQTDRDGDGVGDPCDNCPTVPNADQADADLDGDGDACDICPTRTTRSRRDADGDGIGDACDPDIDGDGIGDDDGDGLRDPCVGGATAGCDDNCPRVANPGQEDADGDGVGDACDGCPADADATQIDRDRDGIGDACDACPDADGDGLCDAADPCPLDAENDADGDGVCADLDRCPAAADPGQVDGDGDGVGDACDLCPATPDRRQRDRDRDGSGNACDADLDGDGLPDVSDPDRDGDGVPEDDGDGVSDPCPSNVFLDCDDNCPDDANPSQVDADDNGRGDTCDLGDGRTSRMEARRAAAAARGSRGTAPEPPVFRWDPEDDAVAYNVYRGALDRLARRDYGDCYRERLEAPEVALVGDPAPGEGWFYLVAVVDALGESVLGVDGDGVERVLDRPCPR